MAINITKLLEHVNRAWAHGSGVNGEWSVTTKGADDKVVIVENIWENMNQLGMYDWNATLQFVFIRQEDGSYKDEIRIDDNELSEADYSIIGKLSLDGQETFEPEVYNPCYDELVDIGKAEVEAIIDCLYQRYEADIMITKHLLQTTMKES